MNTWSVWNGTHEPRVCTRSEFLSRLSLGLFAAAFSARRTVAGTSSTSGGISGVKRWDVITIGNLSRNRYWGESDVKGVRDAICTCTLIQGAGFRLLVDPSLADSAAMSRELDRRAGVKLADVDMVFVSHEHGDHFVGLRHFPHARWCASHETAAELNKTGKHAKAIESVSGKLFDVIDIVPLPGHTMSLAGLRFDCDGFSVMVAGDAVATRDFFLERRGYFNSVDFKLSGRTMDNIARLAQIIVPGHDNYFLVSRVKRSAWRTAVGLRRAVANH